MTDSAKTCARRPYPDRCETCPAAQWPPGGAGAREMRDFRNNRCPHDHRGGPVEWEPQTEVQQAN